MSLDLPPFKSRFPWWGGDLQTLANRFRKPAVLAPHRSERLRLQLDDGDCLLATLDRPDKGVFGKPLVVLIHGLTGSEESSYILSQTRALLDYGFTVLRLNLRGAGASRATCGGQYYAGRSQDFRAALKLIPAELKKGGVAAVGYSLGGAMLLKYLGEEGTAAPLVAAVTISAPIDLSAVCTNMLRPRNSLYHYYLLRQMKREATAEGAKLTPEERKAILGSETIWDYDEVFIAPRHRFGGAEDYYDRCKPVRFMSGIRVPTLVIAGLDDPWIPGRLYSEYAWWKNLALTPMVQPHGGHVGFHSRDSKVPWTDRVVRRFLGG